MITPRLCLLLLVPAACFDGSATRGLPCEDDRSCGPGVSCQDGFCGGEPAAEDDGPSDGGSSEGGPTVRVSGVVREGYFDGDSPLPGVRVSLFDAPEISDVTDAQGGFVLEGVPAGTPAYLVADESAEYWSTIMGVDVPSGDLAMETPLLQVSAVTMQSITDQVLAQDPALVVDEEAGIIVTASVTLDVTAALSPMPPPNEYFALDANGMPVLGSSTIAYVFLPIATFFNLDVGPAGAYEVTGTHATMSCVAPLPSPATQARHLSLVEILCG